jgi:FKBP-type peptidyl-prolyl cis-trans isomerase SlpA
MAIRSPFDRIPVFRQAAMARVETGSHVTLHYRLAVVTDGDEREVVSTLTSRPATLQIGTGQLAPAIEQRLVGLDEGVQARFELPAGEAYGQRHPDLVQTLARATFDAHADPQTEYVPGDIVEFNSAEGMRVSGVLKSVGEAQVVVDFNHPLAGLPLRFTAQIIGVL